MPAINLIQDFLMFVLVAVLLTLVARAVYELGRVVLRSPLDVSASIADALYVFVIIELIEILVVYIRGHRIAVDFMIEVAIISALREVIGHGLTDYSWDQILAISIFLLALGVLLRFGGFGYYAALTDRGAAEELDTPTRGGELPAAPAGEASGPVDDGPDR
jgi:uncharacterized membrane protein (DUF373 family)